MLPNRSVRRLSREDGQEPRHVDLPARAEPKSSASMKVRGAIEDCDDCDGDLERRHTTG
jgi:hypothetical protein